jgi:signal transduction histidine kinase
MIKVKDIGINRYLLGCVAFLIAAALSVVLQTQFEYASTALLLVAIMLTAWWCGRGPALLVTILSSIFTVFILVDPAFSIAVGLNGLVRIVVFIVAALVISSLTARTIAAEREVREFNSVLEQRVRERTAELNEANYKLRAFSYSVAHDLRAPLRALQGFATALSDDYGTRLDESAEDYIRRMVRASERMDRLISDLLNYMELTTREIELVPTDLDQCIQDVLAGMEHRIVQSKAHVEVKMPLGIVLGTTQNVELVMYHLIDNALRFVAPNRKPLLQIWAEHGHGDTKIFFKDNGVGISSEYHERIFGVFQTLHSDNSGTGIGLPTVRAAMLQIQGNVGVESLPGGGSLFWLYFKVPHTDEKLSREAAGPSRVDYQLFGQP